MEEFRPLLADRLALALVNRQQVKPGGFEVRDGGAVAMDEATRKAVVGAWQQRKREEVLHPYLGVKVPAGRLPFLQARVECIAHAIGKQVGGQHQGEHEDESRAQLPPDDRLARQLETRAVDHVAPAIHGRIDTDTDLGEHGLGQRQAREVQYDRDQHEVEYVGENVAADDACMRYAERPCRLDIIERPELE